MENHLPEATENRLPRLTVKEIRNETLLFFNLEKGLLFTFLALIKDPKNTIDTYLNIDRRKFSNPLQYILISVAIYTVLITVHPSFVNTMASLNEQNAKSYAKMEKDLNIKIAEPMARSQKIFLSYQNVLYLILIPIISFATFFLFEKSFNYAENLVVNAFVFGTSTGVSMILTALTIFIDHFAVMMIAIPLFSFVFTGYMYKKIFQEDLLKTIGVTIIVTGLLIFLTMIIQFGLALILMFT